MNVLKIFLSFFKIGVIGFGGGSALIPVVERELVNDQKVMNEEDYLKHTVVANITPGALPVKLGATCGYQLNGIAGSVAGAYGVMLPGVLLTVAIMALFSSLGAQVINYFNYASIGITAFIVFLLSAYVFKTVGGEHLKINLSLCLFAFLLTGGKEIRQILGQLINVDYKTLGTPLFDISTIDLMIITFVMILLLQKLKSKAEFFGALTLCAIYSFCVGKTGANLGLNRFSGWVLTAMIIMVALAFILRREHGSSKSKVHLSKSAVITALIFLLIPIIVTAVIVFCGLLKGSHNAAEFISNISISTITSFGGGEAYVSVADGIFVQGGYVEPGMFYTRLVPVANALPGPILIKIASGIGYLFGLDEGSAIVGWLVALAAATASLGVCSALAVLVMNVYDSVRDSVFILNLKRYILPVICGMLISTSCSMLYESMKITGEKGIAGLISFLIMLAGILVLDFLHKRFHIHDIILLLGSAVVSLVGLLLI